MKDQRFADLVRDRLWKFADTECNDSFITWMRRLMYVCGKELTEEEVAEIGPPGTVRRISFTVKED